MKIRAEKDCMCTNKGNMDPSCAGAIIADMFKLVAKYFDIDLQKLSATYGN